LILDRIYSRVDIENSANYNDMYRALGNISFRDFRVSEIEKSYLVFFLNRVLITGFNLNVDIENLLTIFDEYTEISLSYYSRDDETIIRT
jgi:hypothetical protein